MILGRRLLVRSLRRNKGNYIKGIASTNFLTSIMSFCMGIIFFFSDDLFSMRKQLCLPQSHSDFGFFSPEWYLWETLFFISGTFLLYSSFSIKHTFSAHILSGVNWFIFSMMWVASSTIYGANSVFGFGILGIFIATWHVSTARISRLED